MYVSNPDTAQYWVFLVFAYTLIINERTTAFACKTVTASLAAAAVATVVHATITETAEENHTKINSGYLNSNAPIIQHKLQ